MKGGAVVFRAAGPAHAIHARSCQNIRAADPNRIRQKLANIDPEGNWRFDDDRQLIQRIFDWGVSTRDGASQLSGRGVGLEAVKEEVKKLGGSIKVTSEIYVGTTFEMIIPLPHMKDYQLSSKVA
ncbi:MAG: hypothetical protein EBZ69_09880 [Alphaproteobacteria bacterium]|nr:hypothetical protein [Alphaproteobacteria bacterium]